MLISTIDTAITDRYGTVASAKLNRYIASAVTFYSRYNPRVISTEVTTVIDQQRYSLSSLTGILGIREVIWYPGRTITTNNVAQIELPQAESVRYPLFSQNVIDDIQRNEWEKRRKGYAAYEVATNELYLAPVPKSADTIEVIYYAAHQINEAGDEYTTIPADDEDLIRDLVLADLYETDAFEMAMQPDYREGAESETFSRIPNNVAQVADRLRNQLSMKYGAGAVIDVGP